jgi:SAM-dependent methyltransferase
MKFKRALTRVWWIASVQFGFDPVKLVRSARGAPRFIRDLFRFKASYVGKLELLPCLHDWYEEGGTTKSEYFWQDLLVARMIFRAAPARHVDIGSRVDGFVAHVASFRDVEVFDVREVTSLIPGVTFKQADLSRSLELKDYCESVSCLHALEHFGLGRYGDLIDPHGAEKGLANMARLLRPGGTLYLSVPIGAPRVEFNAHRVFDPRSLVELADRDLLQLKALTVIANGSVTELRVLDEAFLAKLAQERYSLGIFVFSKVDKRGSEHP